MCEGSNSKTDIPYCTSLIQYTFSGLANILATMFWERKSSSRLLPTERILVDLLAG